MYLTSVTLFLSFLVKGEIRLSRSYVYLLPPFLILVLWWMVTLQHVWLLTTAIVFAISMLFYIQAIKREHAQKETAQTKKLLSHIRHDQMNHVQVLMGYLMMNKPDKMSEYLNNIVHQTNKEREIAELNHDELAVYLLMLPYQYSQWQWDIEKKHTYKPLSHKKSLQVVQWLKACMQFIGAAGKDQYQWQKIRLQLSGDEQGNTISFQVYDTDDLPVILHVPATEWTNLKNQLTRVHVKLELVDQQQVMIRI